MLQGEAALKLKGNLYFLISLHIQSNKHILWLRPQYVSHKNWMKDCPAQHFASRLTLEPHTTFNLKEYISGNIPITVIFNLNIDHVYIYNSFTKTCYCKYLNV